jgi:hypothetical protein
MAVPRYSGPVLGHPRWSRIPVFKIRGNPRLAPRSWRTSISTSRDLGRHRGLAMPDGDQSQPRGDDAVLCRDAVGHSDGYHHGWRRGRAGWTGNLGGAVRRADCRHKGRHGLRQRGTRLAGQAAKSAGTSSNRGSWFVVRGSWSLPGYVVSGFNRTRSGGACEACRRSGTFFTST